MAHSWEFYSALYGAAGRHRGRRGPLRGVGKLAVSYGYTVIGARVKAPYGYSTDPRGRWAKRLHLVDGVWSVWRRGKMVGSVARWRCGGMCRFHQLTAERSIQMCWGCLAANARQAEQAVTA